MARGEMTECVNDRILNDDESIGYRSPRAIGKEGLPIVEQQTNPICRSRQNSDEQQDILSSRSICLILSGAIN